MTYRYQYHAFEDDGFDDDEEVIEEQDDDTSDYDAAAEQHDMERDENKERAL